MNAVVYLLSPSNLLQDIYWKIVEAERGSPVGVIFQERKGLFSEGKLQLSVRITSLFHTALQTAYTLCTTLPVFITSLMYSSRRTTHPFTDGLYGASRLHE